MNEVIEILELSLVSLILSADGAKLTGRVHATKVVLVLVNTALSCSSIVRLYRRAKCQAFLLNKNCSMLFLMLYLKTQNFFIPFCSFHQTPGKSPAASKF